MTSKTVYYGVAGEGRGHASRALALIEQLCERHRVVVYSYGQALSLLEPACAPLGVEVRALPPLEFAYSARRTLSYTRTFFKNAASPSPLICVSIRTATCRRASSTRRSSGTCVTNPSRSSGAAAPPRSSEDGYASAPDAGRSARCFRTPSTAASSYSWERPPPRRVTPRRGQSPRRRQTRRPALALRAGSSSGPRPHRIGRSRRN